MFDHQKYRASPDEKEHPQEELSLRHLPWGIDISSEGNYIAKVQDFTFSPESGKSKSAAAHFKDRERS